MSQYLKFIFELLLIVFIVLFFYVITIDIFIFNRLFLQFEYLTWLFYLLPIILCLIFLFGAVFIKNRLLMLILSVSSFSYLALSLFMISGVYCEEEKNLSITHVVFVLLLTLLAITINYKKLLPKLSNSDKILITFSTLIVLIDLYFTLISYDLIYVNVMTFFNLI